jgi:hypothetical protein
MVKSRSGTASLAAQALSQLQQMHGSGHGSKMIASASSGASLAHRREPMQCEGNIHKTGCAGDFGSSA